MPKRSRPAAPKEEAKGDDYEDHGDKSLPPRIIAASACLVSTAAPKGDPGSRSYFPSVVIEHPASAFYRWRVHLGDLVAVAMASPDREGPAQRLTVADLEAWEPEHLSKASTHWRVGLVVGLVRTEVASDNNPSPNPPPVECHVEWLEKVLDTPYKKDKSLTTTYRPYRASQPTFQLPHVLLRTYEYGIVPPAALIPVEIRMKTRESFKEGVKYPYYDPSSSEPDVVKFRFDMHCPKFLESSSTSASPRRLAPEPYMDNWPELNHEAFLKRHETDGVPRPLQRSWARWPTVVAEDTAFVAALVAGYGKHVPPSKHEEYFARKQRQFDHSHPSPTAGDGNEEEETLSRRVRIAEEPTSSAAAPKSQGRRAKQPKPIIKAQKPTSTKRSLLSRNTKEKGDDSHRMDDEEEELSLGEDDETELNEWEAVAGSYRSAKVVTGDPIHTGKHEGQPCRFFERAELRSKKCQGSFLVAVGQLVAVHDLGGRPSPKKQKRPRTAAPRRYRIGQVLAIHEQTDSRTFFVHLRWFLRHREVYQEKLVRGHLLQQGKGKKSSVAWDEEHSLLETMRVGVSSLSDLIAVTIETTSGASPISRSSNTGDDGISVKSVRIRHFWPRERDPGAKGGGSGAGAGKPIKPKRDWEGFDPLAARAKGPLSRLLETKGLRPALLEKIRAAIVARKKLRVADDISDAGVLGAEQDDMDVDDESENGEEGEGPAPLRVYPVKPQPLCKRWGKRFHEGIRMEIDRNSLHTDFSPRTEQWTIRVGYVVPVALEQDLCKKECYPYEATWNPAQIVSIYQDEDGSWKMQIRWFNRFQDLLDTQKKQVGEALNKLHVLFEAEEFDVVDATSCFPGRIVLTSSVHGDGSWNVASSMISGLPLVPRFCAVVCIDEHLEDALDWTDYDVDLCKGPRPFARGLLLDPINRKNKNWMVTLSRYYQKYVKLRGKDPDEETMRQWSGPPSASVLQLVDRVVFNEKKIDVSPGATLYSSDSTHYFDGFSVSVPMNYLTSPSARDRRSSIKVGDMICYYEENPGERPDHIVLRDLRHPWLPYKVPWSVGQVLAIYQNASEGQGLQLEIRHFLRPTDIPDSARVIMPSTEDESCEEVFESDILSTVPASRVLGGAIVFLGHHKLASNHSKGKGADSRASCRCKYFYLSYYRRFQPLFSAALSNETWWKRLRMRGNAISRVINDEKGLRELMYPGKSSILPTIDFRRMLGGTNIEYGPAGQEFTENGRTFFAGANIPLQWKEYTFFDILFDREDRENNWKINVGEVIAARGDNSDVLCKEFPFRCEWVPCQLLAIYTNSKKDLSSLQFEVRYLTTAASPGSADKYSIAKLVPRTEAKPQILQFNDLLGPLDTLRHSSEPMINWDKLLKTRPFIPYIAEDSICNLSKEALFIALSYTKDVRSKFLELQATARNVAVAPMSEKETAKDATDKLPWTFSLPTEANISKLRLHYSEFSMITPSGISEVFSNHATDSKPWKIQSGDIILIHCDGPKRYPFKCNWGVAEVVSIWKQFSSRDDLEREMNSIFDIKDSRGDLEIEIRWYYDRQDIGGTVANMDSTYQNEVFETDDVHVLFDMSCILAPARLHDDPTAEPSEIETHMNVPIQKFLCKRFWSTTRNSLIPCGGLDGREKRAKLHSKNQPTGHAHFSQKQSAAAALSPKSVKQKPTWQESLVRIVDKLNLKHASKQAYEHGESLVGREHELSQLLSFFRAAIRGEPGPGGIRSSIFLAGPPGVGKTACIRAAIARLQHEQSKGTIPKFDFIPLNGMETRHPFEVYVKFIEAITGRKHVGTSEKACESLEFHFTNRKALDGHDGTVTVVLLDEIDYLVTEKQSVLYNFFDWPKRAASIPGGRRLVVVGISNTLNLAEQLMPSVQSRVGSERVAFKAYNAKDAAAILQSKIGEAAPDYTLFEKDAIMLAARKTASLSGDIRKAFQICRAAADLVLQQNSDASVKEGTQRDPKKGHPIVRISDVQKASRQSFDTALVNAVSFSTPFQALLLVSLASLCRTTGREVGGFDIQDVIIKMEALVGSTGDSQYSPAPAFGETLDLLTQLCENDLVRLHTASSSSVSIRTNRGGSGGAWPMASLAVDEHTIMRGLKQTSHKALAEKTLPSMI